MDPRSGPYWELKKRNLELREEDLKFQRDKFDSNPVDLMIEPTNECNLSCSICARRYWKKKDNPEGKLDRNLLVTLEPFFETAMRVFAFGHGEPLLTHVVYMIIEKAAKHGCHTEITTNGILLDAESIERMMQIGLNVLNISIDELDPHAAFGKRDSDPRDTLELLAQYKGRWNRDLPALGVAMVLDRENMMALPDMLKLCNDIGASHLVINHLVAWDESLHSRSAYHEIEKARKLMKATAEEGAKSGIEVVLPFTNLDNSKCPHPISTFTVKSNGLVWPCCSAVFVNDRYSFPVANLHEVAPRKAWNAPVYQRLRRSFFGKEPFPKYCRICPMAVDNLTSHIRTLK